MLDYFELVSGGSIIEWLFRVQMAILGLFTLVFGLKLSSNSLLVVLSLFVFIIVELFLIVGIS